MAKNTLVRLQKFIADSGITSRRKAEHLILNQKVRVNGAICDILGSKINPEEDVVVVGDKPIFPPIDKTYLVLNKPRGHVTTLSDPENRPTVMDLIVGVNTRVFPVGRLDFYSEGLLILTNDGEFAQKVMHPTNKVCKVYEVKVFGKVSIPLLKKLADGISIGGRIAKPLSVRVIKWQANKTWLEFRLEEGRNREIRRICESVGMIIDKLRRVSIENLSIENLPVGHYQSYTKSQIMRKLNLDTKGRPLPKKVLWQSTRPTRRPKAKIPKNQIMANDPKFIRYRRDNYVQTMQRFKESAAANKNAPEVPATPSSVVP